MSLPSIVKKTNRDANDVFDSPEAKRQRDFWAALDPAIVGRYEEERYVHPANYVDEDAIANRLKRRADESPKLSDQVGSPVARAPKRQRTEAGPAAAAAAALPPPANDQQPAQDVQRPSAMAATTRLFQRPQAFKRRGHEEIVRYVLAGTIRDIDKLLQHIQGADRTGTISHAVELMDGFVGAVEGAMAEIETAYETNGAEWASEHSLWKLLDAKLRCFLSEVKYFLAGYVMEETSLQETAGRELELKKKVEMMVWAGMKDMTQRLCVHVGDYLPSPSSP